MTRFEKLKYNIDSSIPDSVITTGRVSKLDNIHINNKEKKNTLCNSVFEHDPISIYCQLMPIRFNKFKTRYQWCSRFPIDQSHCEILSMRREIERLSLKLCETFMNNLSICFVFFLVQVQYKIKSFLRISNNYFIQSIVNVNVNSQSTPDDSMISRNIYRVSQFFFLCVT
jgi:hypothetical protein